MRHHRVEAGATLRAANRREAIGGRRAVADREEIQREVFRSLDHRLDLRLQVGRQPIGVTFGIGTGKIGSRHDPPFGCLPQVQAGAHHQAVEQFRRRFRMAEQACRCRHFQADADGVEQPGGTGTGRHHDLVGMDGAFIGHHPRNPAFMLHQPLDRRIDKQFGAEALRGS